MPLLFFYVFSVEHGRLNSGIFPFSSSSTSPKSLFSSNKTYLTALKFVLTSGFYSLNPLSYTDISCKLYQETKGSELYSPIIRRNNRFPFIYLFTNDERHKMISSSKEEDSPTKKEGNTSDGKIAKPSSSTTPWLRLKDPRIVRVSRAFGGKDRHSKVCTIRGLRDRRVRLSVPTAIQLYDLQDRLGLNQPSKVVDWLLNAAKDEIDELPPLPIQPMNFSLNHLTSHEIGANSQSNKQGCKINSSINWEDPGGLSRPSFWSNDSFLRANSKEVARDTVNEKEKWTKRNEDDQQESNSLYHRASQSSSSGNLSNNTTPYSSFFPLDHPNFPLGGSHGYASQADNDIHNLNAVPLPSTLSLASGSHILVCPPGSAAAQPYFPSIDHMDPRQMNHFQMFASSTQNLFPSPLAQTPYSMNQPTRPFHFNLAPRLFNSHNEGSEETDKDQEFPCK